MASVVAKVILLGGFSLCVNEHGAVLLPRKAQALLAFLLVQRDQQASREVAANLLWADRGDEQARHSLRQTLLVLRQELGPAAGEMIRARSGILSLERGVIDCDLDHLYRLTEECTRESLAEAMRLYSGPLLANFPPLSAEFDDWLVRERGRVARHLLDALGRRAENCISVGAPDEAASLLERMLGIDPLREDLHRRLMGAYVAAGRRGDAVRQYRVCKDTLQRELDIIPAPETEALFEQISMAMADAAKAPLFDTGAGPGRHAAALVHDPPWVAVLPFRASGPDPVPTYFASGLIDDMVCALATLREPIVISSNSTMALRDSATDLRQIGRTLGVRYVLSGSVRRAGRSFRVSTELAETENRTVLWAQAYEVVGKALFAAQDAIVGKIAQTLVPRVREAELRRIRAKRPESMTAYDLVLQARELMSGLDEVQFERAGRLLKRAVDLDADYAAAHGLSADWHCLRLGQGWASDPSAEAEALDRSSHAAIAHDGANARAIALLGHSRTLWHRDYAGATQHLDHALELAPNDAACWLWSSPTYAFIGNGKEAVRRAERAIRLSPCDVFMFRCYHFLATAHFTNDNYEEAVHWGKLSASANPRYTSNLRATAAALAELGEHEEARAMARTVMEIEPGFRVSRLLEHHPYKDAERRARYGQQLIAAGLPA